MLATSHPMLTSSKAVSQCTNMCGKENWQLAEQDFSSHNGGGGVEEKSYRIVKYAGASNDPKETETFYSQTS